MEIHKSKFWIVLSVLILILLISSTVLYLQNGNYETIKAERGDLTQTTEVSGEIVSSEEINLGFENSGKVSKVFFDVGDFVQKGDIVAILDKDEFDSEINEIRALLDSENARLDELTGGGQGITSQAKLESEKTILVSTIKKAHTTSDSLITNVVDVFFENASRGLPEFTVALDNYLLRQKINLERKDIGKLLKSWKEDIKNISTGSLNYGYINSVLSRIESISNFLTLISSGSNEFRVTGEHSQVEIDSYVSAINQARTTLSNLIIDINAATEKVRAVESQIPIQQAIVKNTEALFSKTESRSRQFIIESPIDGIITKRNVESGENIIANEEVISIVNNKDFEIEAFIPEVNISGVDVGDSAILTFEAFGKDTFFNAEIAHIDPIGTKKDGITTYKVILDLEEQNEMIRSGMSVDIEIEKSKTENVILIPSYVLQKSNDVVFVEILNNNGEKERRNVRLGGRDSNGNVEVLKGISEGEDIVILK